MPLPVEKSSKIRVRKLPQSVIIFIRLISSWGFHLPCAGCEERTYQDSLFLNSCSLQVNLHMWFTLFSSHYSEEFIIWTLDYSHNTCDFVICTSIFSVNLIVLLLAELCGRVIMDCTEAFIHTLINNTNFLFYIDDCALIGCI